MEQQIRLRQINRNALDTVQIDLKTRGFAVHAIGKVTNSEDLFNQAKEAFPLDPPISGRVNWDAFADSLWGGLDACNQSKIALVIEDAVEFAADNPREYDLALECLVESANEVESEKRKEGKEAAEIVVVIGVE